MISNWSLYPDFSKREFDCRHTGKNNMQPDFMDVLQEIRKVYNRPMIITSGFRHKTHPIEDAKNEPGEHSYGVAADIACYGVDALELIHIAYEHGIRRNRGGMESSNW